MENDTLLNLISRMEDVEYFRFITNVIYKCIINNEISLEEFQELIEKLINDRCAVRMKIAELHRYGVGININDKEEIEELIKATNLNLSLKEGSNEIEITCDNYADLWWFIFCLSNRSDWRIE